MPVKSLAKAAIGWGAPWTPPLKRVLEQSLTVFIFHDVSDHPAPFSRECDLAVGIHQFEDQARLIAEIFHVISVDDLLARRLPPRAALITFDDGFAGVFRQALPVLRRLRLPCTVFLNTAPVSGEPLWASRAVYLCRHVPGFLGFLAARKGRAALMEPHLACTPELVTEWERQHGDEYVSTLSTYTGPLATPDDLRAAADDPLVTFGNHGHNHYNFMLLPDAAVETNVRAADTALAVYRNYRPVFAFPFGGPGRSFTEHHVALLTQLGQQVFFSGVSRVNRDPFAPLLHRISLMAWHDTPRRIWFQIARAAFDSRGNGHRTERVMP